MSKEYRVVKSGRLYKIEWEGGGQMAKALSGEYTSPAECHRAVAEYEKTKKPSRKAKRGVKNATDESTAGEE